MFKRVTAVLCICLALAACGKNAYVNGKEYSTCGFINQSYACSPKIRYEAIIGNIVWGVILSETIIAPIYFFGFSLWQPVGAIDDPNFHPGEVNG